MLEISLNMILDHLSAYRPEALFEEDNDIFFSGLRLYERGIESLAPKNIYICSSRQLTDSALDSGCCFLCLHRPAPECMVHLRGKRVVLLGDEHTNMAEVFNDVQKLFTDLREWHYSMHVSLIQNNNVQDLLDLSESIIGNPIVLVDLSFKLLAYTRNIVSDDPVYNDLTKRGYHSKETVEALARYKYVRGLKQAKVVDVEFPPEITRYHTVTRTFYIRDYPYAYLRMICSEKPPTKSVIEKFELLSESVEYYLQNHYSSQNVNKYMYEYVLVELLENKISDPDALRERIKCVGLEFQSRYQLLKIVFEDSENASFSYIIEQLLEIFPESRPFTYGNHIVMLMHLKDQYQDTMGWPPSQLQQLDAFLERQQAHCGLSEPFELITRVSDAYVQTTAAIELGQTLRYKKAPKRIFFYRDYYIYHMISACANQMALESLCDSRLLAIREQDKQRNTEYAKLLYTYIVCECKPTDTARILHMHRNNVIYHIEKLTSQMGVDLNDAETRLSLLLSYKVMDLLEAYKAEKKE